MAHCCAVFCGNDFRKKERYLEEAGNDPHFHHFPADSERRKKWIVAIHRDKRPLFNPGIPKGGLATHSDFSQ